MAESSPINTLKRKHSSDDETDNTYEKQVKVKEDPDQIHVEDSAKICDTKNENSQQQDTKSVTVKEEVEDKSSTVHDRLRMSLESDSDDELSNAERYKIFSGSIWLG